MQVALHAPIAGMAGLALGLDFSKKNYCSMPQLRYGILQRCPLGVASIPVGKGNPEREDVRERLSVRRDVARQPVRCCERALPSSMRGVAAKIPN